MSQTNIVGRNKTARWSRASPLVIGSAIGLLILITFAALPTEWLPRDPQVGDPTLRMVAPSLTGPGGLLGTDALGRDLLSTIIAGTRYTLLIVGGAALLSILIGLVTGLIAGYFRGLPDTLIMRLADVQLAFPVLILVIAAVAAVGQSIPLLIVILGVAGWAQYSRVVRGSVLSLRSSGFVETAKSTGIRDSRIMFRHILPNIWGSLVVYATNDFSKLVILEASLSFLGLGVPPPLPSWGAIIADSRQYLTTAWWPSVFAGTMIVVTVLILTVLGDYLRDRLDPRNQGASE